jgi:hypothetical protein
MWDKSKNLYLPDKLNAKFFKSNSRFRYLQVAVKPAFYGSDRRVLTLK